MDPLRDFDEEREERRARPNTFKIGGETFTFRRGLRPEVFSEAIAEYAALPIDAKAIDTIPVIDATIKRLLVDDGNREMWDTVRASDDDAITAGDMRRVLFWLIEEQTDRPTEAPSSSGDGRTETGANSTERSSLRPVASAG